MSRTSLLCPSCQRLISADEPACPYCGLRRPAARWRWIMVASRDDGSQMVTGILVLNLVMYLGSLVLSRPGGAAWFSLFGFLSPDQESLFLLGASGRYPVLGEGRWWTLLAANYLHGGLLHLVFNLTALRQLAPRVVDEYGVARFLAIYTFGGIAGYVASVLAGVPFTIGASAAICALIGALYYYGRSRGGVYGRAVYQEVRGWIMGLLLFGLLVPGINNWAHGGGLVGGMLAGWLLGYAERRREAGWHRVLAYGCGVATMGVLGWALYGVLLAMP